MKRYYAICTALVVGTFLVGPVHAGPPHSSHHSRQRSAPRSRQHSGRPWKMLRPKLRQLPWQWLPEQLPGTWGYAPNAGGYDPTTVADDPNAVVIDPNNSTEDLNPAAIDPNIPAEDPNAAGADPNTGDSQRGADAGGGSLARPPVTPKGGSPKRLPQLRNGPSRIPGSRPRGPLDDCHSGWSEH
jgi:hypothetical protein